MSSPPTSSVLTAALAEILCRLESIQGSLHAIAKQLNYITLTLPPARHLPSIDDDDDDV